jgi:hypothetical protein
MHRRIEEVKSREGLSVSSESKIPERKRLRDAARARSSISKSCLALCGASTGKALLDFAGTKIDGVEAAKDRKEDTPPKGRVERLEPGEDDLVGWGAAEFDEAGDDEDEAVGEHQDAAEEPD